MTGNVQLYLTGVGRVLHRMEARLAGDGGWVKGRLVTVTTTFRTTLYQIKGRSI